MIDINFDSVKEERDTQLIVAYKKTLEELGDMTPHLSRVYIVEKALNKPTPKFYITSHSFKIREKLYSMNSEDDKVSGRESQNLLYKELYKRFHEEKKLHTTHNDYKIIEDIINQPAPRLYMELETAMRKISKFISDGRI
jgi:hypothetical protein